MATPHLTISKSDKTVVLNSESDRKHLPFLDGIRALMALWVASGHAFQDFIHVVDSRAGNTEFLPQPFFQEAFFAHFAVDVFIVLSGFCLMLPVAKTKRFELKGGWKAFIMRRAQRILPPYYAALLLAGGMSYLRFRLTYPGWEAQAIRQIDFRPTAIAAHLFLVQNMWDPWARALDGPTWSVATECQIYLLFPAFLLPLWRRLKPVWVVALATLMGVGIYLFTPYGLSICSWYLALFSMGMLSAEWYRQSSFLERRRYWLLGAICLTAVGFLLIVFDNWMPRLMWALDIIFGMATALTLVYLATSNNANKSPLMKLLEWGPLVALGTFSYSFYLIHAPLLNVPITILLMYHATGIVGGAIILISLVAIVGIARLFYLLVELPAIKSMRPR